MKEYICEKCNTQFKQKIDYTRHINKKYPCVTQEDLKSSKFTENESLKKLEAFFSRLRDILRDNENITGHKALDVMTDFLLLRLLNLAMDKKQTNMNFTTKKYNKTVKLDGIDLSYDIDEYKKYFKWAELVNLVKEIDTNGNIGKKDLLNHIVIYVIFGGILKFHEQTKEIYKNKKFLVQKTTTIIKMIKEYDKINFDDYDVDVKGKAYELTIQKEASSNKDFGQFFTPRWVDKYMVQNSDVEVNDDGTYTKCLDPACGTAGILTEYISNVQKIAEKQDVILDKNVNNFIFGFEIVDDTIKIAHMNILLKSGAYDENIKCIDFLECGCGDYNDNNFDGNIITNPPFALTKNYEDLFADNEDMFPVKTKSGSMLFLQACTNILEKGRKCIMVSPNGKEIFGKNKEFINLRKHIADTCDLYKIALLPSGTFKPYTGVETLILMMKKGSKTKEIQFVKVDKNTDDTTTETKICKVKFSELEKHNYSWNYKDYCVEKVEKYGDVEYKKLGDVCEFIGGKRRKVSEVVKNGQYNFYTCSIYGCDTIDVADFTEPAIIINAINGGGKCAVYCDNKYSTTSNNIHFKINGVNILYIYKYLKTHIELLEEGFQGQNQKKITNDYIKNIKIPIPSLQVQEVIVNELDMIHKQKEALQQSIDCGIVTKKAKFEMLLRECENVEDVKFGDYCSINIGGTPSTKNNKYYDNGKNLWLQISDMKNKYIYDTKDKITNDGINNSSVKKINIGDVLLSFKLSVGKVAIATKEMYCNEAIAFFNGGKYFINDYLYFYFLVTDITEGKAGSIGSGSLNKEKLNNLIIKLPSKKDQGKIVKEMEKFYILEKLQKEQIEDLDKLIKQRFEYHLERCKKEKNNKNDDSDELGSNLGDEKPIKVNKIKKTTKKIIKVEQSDESESNSESEKSCDNDKSKKT